MRAEDIIISQIKTEKAEELAAKAQYVFKVNPLANKTKIKEAIEEIFKVKVKKVRVINVHPKKRTFRGKVGFKRGFKKAIITLKEGKIEIK